MGRADSVEEALEAIEFLEVLPERRLGDVRLLVEPDEHGELELFNTDTNFLSKTEEDNLRPV